MWRKKESHSSQLDYSFELRFTILERTKKEIAREREKYASKKNKQPLKQKRTGAIKWKRNTIHFTSNKWKAKSVSFSPFAVNHCSAILSVCQRVSAWCLKDNLDSLSCVIFSFCCLRRPMLLKLLYSSHVPRHSLLLMNFTDIMVFITFPKIFPFSFISLASFHFHCFTRLAILVNLCDTIIMWKETKRNGN